MGQKYLSEELGVDVDLWGGEMYDPIINYFGDVVVRVDYGDHSGRTWCILERVKNMVS